MSSKKDVLLHRKFYLLRLAQLGIFLFCVAEIFYFSYREMFPHFFQIGVVVLVALSAVIFWRKKKWLLFILAVYAVLASFDVGLPDYLQFVREAVLFSLCVVNIVSMELNYARINFSLTMFPPGTGTFSPTSVRNLGRFLSLWELMFTHKWTKGGIFIGRPLPEQRLFGLFNSVKVGPKDDRHLLTIASARSGKGSAVIIPNLIYYPGSVIAVDPKGELATITAARRGNGNKRVKKVLGQHVYIFDPEEIVRNHHGCCWNPLAELDINHPQLWASVERISSVLIPLNDDPQASFFTNHARTLLSAIIAFVLAEERENRHNLIYVRRLIMEGNLDYYNTLVNDGHQVSDAQEALLLLMSQNSAHGGKVARTARSFNSMASETKSSIMGTLQEQTGFLDHPGLEKYLRTSDFQLADIKRHPSTLYVTIKDTSLATPLVKMLTLFVDLAIVALANDITQRPKHNVLFVLDEFPTLGRVESIEKGMGLIAGYGITLWPIVQNISQLEALYPKSYKTFLTNTRGTQFFGELEEANLKYIEDHCGKRIQKLPDGSTQEVPLLSVNTLKSDYFVRSDRRQVFLPQGRPAALLELVDYYKFTNRRFYEKTSDIEYVDKNAMQGGLIRADSTDESSSLEYRTQNPAIPEISVDSISTITSNEHGLNDNIKSYPQPKVAADDEPETVSAEANIPTGFILSIDPFRTYRLDLNDHFGTDEFTELRADLSSGLVAKVAQHPTNPALFGFTNLSDDAWFHDTQNGFEIIETGKSITLKDGLELTMGTLAAEIHENPVLLLLSDDRILVLNKGRKITKSQLSDLMPKEKGGKYVAEVVTHLNDDKVVGLKNLSASVWQVVNPKGESGTVPPESSIVLREGTTLNFGQLEAQMIL